MRYKILSLSLLYTLASTISIAQTRKFIYFEGLGSGVLLHVNYDMRIKKDRADGFGFKVGIGNTGVYLDDNITTIPIGINYIIGNKQSGLLLGANATLGLFVRERSSDIDVMTNFVPSLEIGYRYTPLKNGFGFQVSYNPLFNTVDGFKPLWFGIGLGYSFK